jgi:hypothetical protein
MTDASNKSVFIRTGKEKKEIFITNGDTLKRTTIIFSQESPSLGGEV